MTRPKRSSYQPDVEWDGVEGYIGRLAEITHTLELPTSGL
jgi:hypothetical protein